MGVSSLISFYSKHGFLTISTPNCEPSAWINGWNYMTSIGQEFGQVWLGTFWQDWQVKICSTTSCMPVTLKLWRNNASIPTYTPTTTRRIGTTAASSTVCHLPLNVIPVCTHGDGRSLPSSQRDNILLWQQLKHKVNAHLEDADCPSCPPALCIYLAGNACKLLFARCRIRRLVCPANTGMHWSVRLLLVK